MKTNNRWEEYFELNNIVNIERNKQFKKRSKREDWGLL